MSRLDNLGISVRSNNPDSATEIFQSALTKYFNEAEKIGYLYLNRKLITSIVTTKIAHNLL